MSFLEAALSDAPRFLIAIALSAIAFAIIAIARFLSERAFRRIARLFERDPPPAAGAIARLVAARREGGKEAGDALALLDLHAWLSPATPLGALLRNFDGAPMREFAEPLLPERIRAMAADENALEVALRRLRAVGIRHDRSGRLPEDVQREMRRRQSEDGAAQRWADAAAAVVGAWQSLSSVPEPESRGDAIVAINAETLARSPGRSEALAFVLHRAFLISDAVQAHGSAALLLGALLKLERRMGGGMLDRQDLLENLARRLQAGGRFALALRLWRSAAARAEERVETERAAACLLQAWEASASLVRNRTGAPTDALLNEGASLLQRALAMRTIAPTTRAKALSRLGGIRKRQGREAEGAAHLREALDLDLQHRDPDDPVLRVRIGQVALDLMRGGDAGAREALSLLEMAHSTAQPAGPEGFADAEAADMARLMAICLTILASGGDQTDEFASRAQRIVERFDLDRDEVKARAREFRAIA